MVKTVGERQKISATMRKVGRLLRGMPRQLLGGGRFWALVLLMALIGVRYADPLAVQTMRLKVFDLFHRAAPRAPVQGPNQVVVIDIDEASLNTIGQWPWPRTRIAEMAERAIGAGALVVGFDVVFAEPDRLSPELVVADMDGIDPALRTRLLELPSNDQRFADSLARLPVVLGHAFYERNVEGGIERPFPKGKFSLLFKSSSGVADPKATVMEYIPKYGQRLGNLSVLENAARGIGMFGLSVPEDGIVRRVDSLVRIGDALYPTLVLEMLRVAAGQRNYLVQSSVAGMEAIGLRGLGLIPTDRGGRIWVHFRPFDRASYVSAKDVLAGTLPPDALRGKLVLVGTSAVGLFDLRVTPVSGITPGVDVHAQLLENILSGKFLTRPNVVEVVELGILLLSGLLMIMLVPWAGARWTLLVLIGIAGAVGAGAWYAYTDYLLLIDPSYPVAGLFLIYVVLVYVSHSREEAARRQVRNAFSHYMSPALVEQLAAEPDRLRLGGEMREMTLLFCDVRGFTTVSEMFDAEGLTRLINRFLTPMTDVILHRGGTIDKYMGDCIMAFWNAPLDDANHPRHACDAALTMIERLEVVNDGLEQEAKEEGRRHVPLRIGIGLNSGPCCVGNMGSDQRFDYSVLGDTVNLASRLEGQSKTYGVTMVIGEATHAAVPDFATLELDRIRVKGKTVPVTIFALLGRPEVAQSPAFGQLVAIHDTMIATYRRQDWKGAREALAQARDAARASGLDLDGLYDLYAERVATFIANPPGADWDGVFVATTK